MIFLSIKEKMLIIGCENLFIKIIINYLILNNLNYLYLLLE